MRETMTNDSKQSSSPDMKRLELLAVLSIYQGCSTMVSCMVSKGTAEDSDGRHVLLNADLAMALHLSGLWQQQQP
jgi:hypothetical protein